MEKDMYELREMLMDELHKIVTKGELTAGSLETIDKLTHSIKSVDTICAMKDGGYSKDGMYAKTHDGHSYGYRRGYSRGEGCVDELRDIMNRVSDNKSRMIIQRAIEQLEN